MSTNLNFPLKLIPVISAALVFLNDSALGGPSAVAESPVITSKTSQRIQQIEAALNGSKHLYLAVSSEGDIACDWADWIEPEIVLKNGTVIDLTTINWKSNTQGSGSTNIGLNNQKKPLVVDGKAVTRGIGTHADSLIAYELPADADKFRAKVAIDDGGMKRDGKLSSASMKFMVFTSEPTASQLTGQIDATEVPLELFSLPDGLEITIWAKTPLLRNPTNIDFDANGRLWVAEGVNYRSKGNRQPEGDRIVILEDTKGSGSADRSIVFVQEPDLASPLGIAVFENRIVVSQPPNMIVYTDVNQDGKFDPTVDRREVLLTGFGGRQHDHSLHSVTAGPDGLWYWNQGNTGAEFTDKSGKTFRMGSPYQMQNLAGLKSDDGHVWIGGFAARMNPDGSNVRIIGHNFRNSYEQSVTSFGDVFQSDNDDPPACRVSAMMEGGNAGFASADGKRAWSADRRPNQSVPTAEWRQDDPGTMPAGDIYGGGAPTGVAFYENGALGKKWEGLLLACESGKNVVFGYHPTPDGAGWKLERQDFLTSNAAREWAGSDFLSGAGTATLKNWFRPSDVCVGPDGAIYVADWFDAKVGGHGTRDDRTTGAIYRIAPKGFKSQVPKLDLSTTAGQITALKSPAVNIRHSGFIRLKAQGEKAVPAVAELLKDSNPYIAARAIWLLAQMGESGEQKVRALFDSKDDNTRLVAYRSLHRVLKDSFPITARFAEDPSPALRREVAVHLRDEPAARSVPLLQKIAAKFDGKDRAYLEAVGLGSEGKESAVYAQIAKSFAKNSEEWDASAEWLTWRLHPAEATTAITTRAQSQKITLEQRNLMLTALAFTPTKAAADGMISIAANKQSDTASAALWWLLHRKNNDWQTFDIAATLKSRGIHDSGTVKLVSVELPPSVPAATPFPAVQDILRLKGDVSRGRTAVGACYACHKIADQGMEFGPALTDFAKQQTPETIIEAITRPSATISHGYEGSTLVTKDGTSITGIIQGSGDPVIIKSMGNITQQVPREIVGSLKKLNRSLMYDPEQLGLTGQSVADIVAYLKSL